MRKLAVLSLVAITGCASYRPITDMQGVNAGKYEDDLAQCQAYADQVSPATRAAASAGAMAVIGAVMGAFTGNRHTASQMAGLGATLGAAHGAANGAEAQINVVRQCMAGRGYKVLQ